MAQIYHGCMTKNSDGTNRIIGPGWWFVPTDKCFWKDPEDIDSWGVKTCSQTINQPAVCNKDYNHHFENKKYIRQWISETYTMKESDDFYVA